MSFNDKFSTTTSRITSRKPRFMGGFTEDTFQDILKEWYGILIPDTSEIPELLTDIFKRFQKKIVFKCFENQESLTFTNPSVTLDDFGCLKVRVNVWHMRGIRSQYVEDIDIFDTNIKDLIMQYSKISPGKFIHTGNENKGSLYSKCCKIFPEFSECCDDAGNGDIRDAGNGNTQYASDAGDGDGDGDANHIHFPGKPLVTLDSFEYLLRLKGILLPFGTNLRDFIQEVIDVSLKKFTMLDRHYPEARILSARVTTNDQGEMSLSVLVIDDHTNTKHWLRNVDILRTNIIVLIRDYIHRCDLLWRTDDGIYKDNNPDADADAKPEPDHVRFTRVFTMHGNDLRFISPFDGQLYELWGPSDKDNPPHGFKGTVRRCDVVLKEGLKFNLPQDKNSILIVRHNGKTVLCEGQELLVQLSLQTGELSLSSQSDGEYKICPILTGLLGRVR